MKKIDFHVHIEKSLSTERSVYYFKDMCERYGYCGVNVLAYVYDPNISDRDKFNRDALELKEKMGTDSYAFGCLLPDADYAKQAEKLMSSGFDGIKLLRGGKPNYYRNYPYIYDDERYADFFYLAEERQIPIIMHNNDPAYSWDITKATPRAIAKGWVYGDDVPSHERYYKVIDNVLARHPKLNIALAHMGFYTENIEKAKSLMETYPNLKLDVTPALNIYSEMSESKDAWESFIRKYHDRLIFGTDATNYLVDEDRVLNDRKNKITSYFFSGEEPKEIERRYVSPVKLDPYMLENIYYNNAMRFIGKEI